MYLCTCVRKFTFLCFTTFIGEAVGEQLLGSRVRCMTGRIPEEVCDTIHALHGVPHSRADPAAWKHLEVFWAGYVYTNMYCTVIYCSAKALYTHTHSAVLL